ncbi:hypothetical protein Tco_0923126 [Tanacetum coccineum]|uniref:Uncharacterized protein n=1 Tax=Tanacetum coccineum TaxID=301880 RepID=A0ABQ5D1M4_9ASTR
MLQHPPASTSGTPGTSGSSGFSQLPLPPLPSSTGTSGSALQQGSRAPSSSKTAASTLQSMAWTTSDTRYESVGVSAAQESYPIDSLMNDDSIPDEQVHLSDDKDTRNDHLPKADIRKDWWKPLPEEERPTTPELAWTIPPSNVSYVENNWATALVNKTVLTQADFKRQAYEVVKAFYPNVIQLQFQMEECHKMLTDQISWVNPEGDQVRIDVNRPLPLGGPPGHVTIQTHLFFNKYLKYLRYGNKGSRPTLLISKMKVARYPDFGLKLLMPEQIWIDEVCTYDISAAYTLWYDYLIEIILRRAAYQEYMIAKIFFKNLYPSDFEDLNLLFLQGHLDHLPGSEKNMLSTAVKLWTRNLASSINMIIPSLTLLEKQCSPVNNKERKIMRFNEIYKFSDGTLMRILEALDYRVKEFKLKRLNPGMNTGFWTKKDVTRSKEFTSAIERQLKTRRIYRNLDRFVGGRVRDIDYRLL